MDIGKDYKKSELGIFYPATLKTSHFINDEMYQFFVFGVNSQGEKFNNYISNDGIVIELRHTSQWGHFTNQKDIIVNVFGKINKENYYTSYYTYFGKSYSQILLEDKKHVKILLDIKNISSFVLKKYSEYVIT